MRQIKFRGKRLDNGEWVYGHYADYIHPDCGIPSPSIIYTLPDCGNMIVAVNPSTIGQFTGLLDRNGKEIYEGDILIYIDRNANEHYREVVYHNGCFKFHNPYAKLPDTPICNHLMYGSLNWEVIGNIHDNPELLNPTEA